MRRLNLIILGLLLIAAVFTIGASSDDNDNMLQKITEYEKLYEVMPDQPPIEYKNTGPVKVSKIYSSLDNLEDKGNISLLSRSQDKVLIIVGDSILYDSISDSLTLYKTDLENECYNVEIHIWEGGTRDDMRSFLQSHQENLVGAIMVGNLPIPMFNFKVNGANCQAPMDLGYMDLDADWYDRDEINGWDYVNKGQGDLLPEIWIGWLYADHLDSAGNQVELLNDYFSRNHQYRTGKIKPSHIALKYEDNGIGEQPPSDEYDSLMKIIFDTLHTVYGAENATKSGYIDSLNEDYEWVHLRCHSGVKKHSFHDPDESTVIYAHYYEIESANCSSIYYFLYCCEVNNWKYANNIGRYYVFGNTLGLLNSAYVTSGGVDAGQFLILLDSLTKGYTCGDAMRQLISTDAELNICPDSSLTEYWNDTFIGFHCFIGDPTLKPLRRTWIINSAGTGDAPTIQAAIDSAQCGDVIILEKGTFGGSGNYDLDFNGKAVTVTAGSDNARVIIDCNDNGRAFRFHSGETSNAKLIGVSIVNGYSDSAGGAILIDSGSSPLIMNCLFYDNYTADSGGAIAVLDSSKPEIEGCTIVQNDAGNGAGIYINSSAQPNVYNCIIYDNDNCGITYSGSDSSIVSCSNIYSNPGGDICGSIDFAQINNNLNVNPKFCNLDTYIYTIDSMSLCNEDYNECEEHMGSEKANCLHICGDADGSGDVSIDDVVYIINFIFQSGPAPDPYYTGDVNCSDSVDIDDLVYLIAFIFEGGPPPCDTDDDGAPDC